MVKYTQLVLESIKLQMFKRDNNREKGEQGHLSKLTLNILHDSETERC